MKWRVRVIDNHNAVIQSDRYADEAAARVAAQPLQAALQPSSGYRVVVEQVR